LSHYISLKKTLRLAKKGNESDNREDGGTQERKRQKKAGNKLVHKYKENIEIKVENFWPIRGGGRG